MYFVTTKPALQKIFKGLIHTEDENKYSHESMGINESHKMGR
jgi:hypothetical protein